MPLNPSVHEIQEALLSCRYGDLDDIRQFVVKFGGEDLHNIHDDNGNTVLHMISGNGHEGARSRS